jgi:7,8-dihydropterin-6-yl-methyl-4-(beta-D-ribofuranosyl)aminobenzene 5'-phosphate synthase
MEADMARTFGRRDFLVGSAALTGAAVGGFTCVELASAAPIDVYIFARYAGEGR